jgi:hypothetical protein
MPLANLVEEVAAYSVVLLRRRLTAASNTAAGAEAFLWLLHVGPRSPEYPESEEEIMKF